MKKIGMIGIIIILALIALTTVIIVHDHYQTKDICNNKEYSYIDKNSFAYVIKENLISFEKLVKGETSISYGIPTIASTSKPVSCVNYSNLLTSHNDSQVKNSQTIWSNETHKISICSPHFKSLVDKDGNLHSTVGYHNIYFFNGYIIAGNGAGRCIVDQYGNPISGTNFVIYNDSNKPEIIFGLIVGDNSFIGADYLNPGKFNIIASEYNSWLK